MFGFPVSYMSLFFIGLPLASFLTRSKKLNLITLVFFGGVSGFIVLSLLALFIGWLLDSTGPIFSWLNVVWGAGLGISVALPFGLIAGVPFRKEKAMCS